MRRLLPALVAVGLLAPAAAKAHNGCHTRACHKRVLNDDRREQIRKLTPYRCATGRWAIPCSIIACESGGRWWVENSIGAKGPYQFLGKRVINRYHWPVRNLSDRLAHHRLASNLWQGGNGRSHWAECL